MESSAIPRSSDEGMTATAYALASSPEEKHAVTLKAKSGLETGALKLSSIVLSMQDLVFDHSDPDQRSGEAMGYLVSILKELRNNVLSRADISLLTKFLESNLKNDPSRFKQTCQALQSLSSMTRFTSRTASELVSVIYNDAGETFGTQPVTTRFEAYKLLNQLLNSHRKVVREMGVDFIRIVDSLAATERDPRNLMLVFTMIEVILNEWEPADIKETGDELYETLQRYFPISFRPKPNDPVTITANDLIFKLRGCFAAYSGFAPSLFPDLIQRLDDPNRLNAKDDVLETMAACIERYEPGVAAQWSNKLWDALKYEIFNSSDDSKAPNAMKVLTVVANRLSLGHTLKTIEGSPLQTYIYLITTECLTRLREEGHKSGRSVGQILARVASGSAFSYHLVIRATLPALLSQIDKTDITIDDKRAALGVINQLLDFRLNVERMDKGDVRTAFTTVENDSARADAASIAGENVGVANGGLPSYRDRLTSALTSIAREPIPGEKKYRITAIQGLSRLLQLANFLDDNDINMHIQYFASVITEPADDSDDVKKEAVKALEECAITYPSKVVNSALPILFKQLPDTVSGADRMPVYMSILHAISKIFARSSSFPSLIEVLEQKLASVIESNAEQTYAHWILASILDAVMQREKQEGLEQQKANTNACLQGLTGRLLERTFELGSYGYIQLRAIQQSSGSSTPDDQFVMLVGEIVMVCIRSGEGATLFKSKSPFSLLLSDEPESSAAQKLFDLTDPSPDQVQALSAASYILAGLPRQHKLDIDSSQTTEKLVSYLCSNIELSPTLRSSLLNLLAVLVNKHTHLLPIKEAGAAEKIKSQIIDPISSGQLSQAAIKNSIQVFATILQAANLAGNKHTTALLEQLLSSLDAAPPVGAYFAAAFDAILLPSPILTSENNAIVRGLYKQRLFSLCVPVILEKFSATHDQEVKSNYLVALGGILKNVPGDMIMPYIDRLLPFLLQSVESGSEDVKGVSIDVIRIATIESPDAVESHVSGIVKRLLACLEEIDGKYRTKVATRCKALKALGVLPKCVRMSVVLPLKKSVLAGLRKSGEDRSRKVREGVVDCLMVWWKLAGVEEEE